MPNDSLQNKLPQVRSISLRFSFTLIIVVTLLLIIFASIGILINISRMERELETRLDDALRLAQKSLPTPLWNMDSDVVHDFVQALFLDDSIVYTKISWGDQVITQKERPEFEMQKLGSTFPETFLKRSEYIVKSSDISFEENKVGNILIVMSRKGLTKQAILQVYGIVALTILIVAAIWITSIVITKRYISRPLLKLQEAASLIAQGDLYTFIDKDSPGEIGILAEHLDAMRGSIKQLFEELSESKQKLEEYSRTLEQKVEVRTRELARSVEELKALGEVSQAVSSTLDLEVVLSSIVRHAVQLSKADAGTIYEFDEAKGVFVPRINYGVSQDFIEAIREAGLHVGDETVIGRAAIKQGPDQIPDLDKVPDYPLPYVKRAGFRALLALPLLRENRLIGGLIVRRKAAGEFPEPILELLQTFAAQSVLAIHNARLFREIEEKGREIEIANKHKSEFLANMSHELRTPMNAIIGFTRLVRRKSADILPLRQQENLKRVEISANQLLTLINDILDLSKIEAGKMTVNIMPLNLASLIDTCFATVEPMVKVGRVHLTKEVPHDLPEVASDQDKLKQIIINLLSNALKFTEEGEVRLSATLENASLRIAVSDTGIGIPSNAFDYIFDEFRQVDGSSTREHGGTGLGLSITKKLTHLLGGTIDVSSVVGKGSTFTVILPLAKME